MVANARHDFPGTVWHAFTQITRTHAPSTHAHAHRTHDTSTEYSRTHDALCQGWLTENSAADDWDLAGPRQPLRAERSAAQLCLRSRRSGAFHGPIDQWMERCARACVTVRMRAHVCSYVQACVRACVRDGERVACCIRHVAHSTFCDECAHALRLRDQTTKPVHGLDLRGGNGTLVLMHYDL